MFRLLIAWDAERELSPEDFQYILTPREAFHQARIFYDINSDNYRHPSFSCHDVPRRKTGHVHRLSAPDRRRRSCYVDDVYDHTERNLDQGWIIGIDTSEPWSYYRNPFYFDDDSNLVYDCFMDHYHEWFEREVRKAYEKCLNHHHGRKPSPTVKQAYYGDAPVQYAQAGKTLNSKGVGRLLAAGGIYNGNIEAFRQTAEQLGGEAPAGHDQVLNQQTGGMAIAAASILAAISKSGAVNEVVQIEKLAGGGAARAKKFAQNWPSGNLDTAINKFAGSNPMVTMTESGKRIYAHPETGIQVIEDVSGKYFRINDPSLPGKRTYLDLDGNIPNNKILDTGKQVGRTQSEYNEVTHFNINGGK